MGFESFRTKTETEKGEELSISPEVEEALSKGDLETILSDPSIATLDSDSVVKFLLDRSNINPIYLKLTEGVSDKFEDIDMEDIVDALIEAGSANHLHQSFVLGQLDELDPDKLKSVVSTIATSNDPSLTNEPFEKKISELGLE